MPSYCILSHPIASYATLCHPVPSYATLCHPMHPVPPYASMNQAGFLLSAHCLPSGYQKNRQRIKKPVKIELLSVYEAPEC